MSMLWNCFSKLLIFLLEKNTQETKLLIKSMLRGMGQMKRAVELIVSRNY